MIKYGIGHNPTDLQEIIASNHKKIRKQQGLTQEELAIRAGVSLGSLKRFERTGQISLEALLKLAACLNRMEEFEMLFRPLENYKAIEKLFSDTKK